MVKVSVLMPLFNREDLVSQAISSVLSQTFQDFEFIIIDDGSTDKSVNIVESFNDPRIKLIKNEKNLGIIKTLNKGIEQANGTYLARMDSDDLCLPERLEKQVKYMEKNKEVSICGTWINTIDYNGRVDSNVKFPYKSYKECEVRMYFNCIFAHPSIMFRVSDFKNNNLLYSEEFMHVEDFELWNRIVMETNMKIINIPEYLLKYRLTTDGITRTKRSEQISNGAKIRSRIFKKYKIALEEEYLSKEVLNLNELKYIEKKLKELLVEYTKGTDEEKNKYFSQAIFDEWISYSTKGAEEGTKTLYLFLSSEIFKLNLINAKNNILILKLLIKTLMKYKKERSVNTNDNN